MKKTKEKKGITLIALVITIIILIILAAVTLGVLTGDNGIITRAINARENTRTGQETELVNLVTSKIRIEEKIGEEVTQEKLQGYINEVFGVNKATGTVSTNNNITTYTILVTGGGTYTITAEGIAKQTGNIIENPEVGTYIKYGITYADMFQTDSNSSTGKLEYDNSTKELTAWRYLGKQKDSNGNETGNHLIVSTGIPALLYYLYNGGNTTWWGTTGNANVKAAYGMKEKFTSIPFKYGTSSSDAWGSTASNQYNRGVFIKVNDVTGTDISGNRLNLSSTSFIDSSVSSKVIGIHEITLEEVNRGVNSAKAGTPNYTDRADEATTAGFKNLDGTAKGLFNLLDLSNRSNGFSYWIAFPFTSNYVHDVGEIVSWYDALSGCSNQARGVRPVIVLSSSVQFVESNIDGVLELK